MQKCAKQYIPNSSNGGIKIYLDDPDLKVMIISYSKS